MNLRWSHAFVYVESLDTMLDFYTNVLGFEITDRGERNGIPLVFLSQVDTDHHQIAFSATRTDLGSSNNVSHFAFRVGDLNSVKHLYRQLKKDDRVKSISPVTHGNAWSIYFSDPEGNGIEVFCDTPWHVSQPMGGTWNPEDEDSEIVSKTHDEFKNDPSFRPIESFYKEFSKHLSTRGGEPT